MAWALFQGRSLLTSRRQLRLDTERELRAALQNRLLLLLFAARRCPRCRGFEPRLRRFWRRLTDPAHVERPEQVALVYVGMAGSESEHRQEVGRMERGWMALPYGDRLASDLQLRFSVSSLPTLVVLSPCGSVLAANAVQEILDSGPSCFRAWREAAELLDRNFQERQEWERTVPRRSLTEPLRRRKYRLPYREEEQEEEEEEEEEEERE